MLYQAKTDTDAIKGGNNKDPNAADNAVVDKVCKLMARALHPGTGKVEAAAALRLAQSQMAKHQLEEAVVMHQLNSGRCKGGGADQQGGICTVRLTLFDPKKWARRVKRAAPQAERTARPQRAAAVRVNYDEGCSGSGGDGENNSSGGNSGSSGGSSDSSEEEEEVSGPSRTRRRSLWVQRYIFYFLTAMEKLCHVSSFYTSSAEAVVITFYGVLAQTQVAAYQLEVAINTATDLAMQLHNKMDRKSKATEHVDYMTGFGRGLREKVEAMAIPAAPEKACPHQPPAGPPPPVILLQPGDPASAAAAGATSLPSITMPADTGAHLEVKPEVPLGHALGGLEVKPEAQPPASATADLGVKPELKPEVKPEVKPEAQPLGPTTGFFELGAGEGNSNRVAYHLDEEGRVVIEDDSYEPDDDDCGGGGEMPGWGGDDMEPPPQVPTTVQGEKVTSERGGEAAAAGSARTCAEAEQQIVLWKAESSRIAGEVLKQQGFKLRAGKKLQPLKRKRNNECLRAGHKDGQEHLLHVGALPHSDNRNKARLGAGPSHQ